MVLIIAKQFSFKGRCRAKYGKFRAKDLKGGELDHRSAAMKTPYVGIRIVHVGKGRAEQKMPPPTCGEGKQLGVSEKTP